MRRNDSGFTLIELVVVISIIAILAAVALPRFVSLQSEARTASLAGIRGSFGSAISLAHAKWLAGGTGVAGNVALEGATVAVNAAGRPTIARPNGADGSAPQPARLTMPARV